MIKPVLDHDFIPAKARAFRPEDNELEDDKNDALKMVGVSKKYEATFPNIEMNRRQTECNAKLV